MMESIRALPAAVLPSLASSWALMNATSAERAVDCAFTVPPTQKIIAPARHARFNIRPSPFSALGGGTRFLGRAHAEYYCSQYLFFRGDLAFLESNVRIQQRIQGKIDGLSAPLFRSARPYCSRGAPRPSRKCARFLEQIEVLLSKLPSGYSLIQPGSPPTDRDHLCRQ